MNNNPLIIVIGAYGSGKSEYAINLAKEYKLNNYERVSLIDMDIVNPYFRSRDIRDEFEKEGIEVIAPDGHFTHADLPMISPRIKGAINDLSKAVILDVGGDPAGCKVLGRFSDDIKKRTYTMHFVINTKRPFTADYYDIINMKNMLESTSRLKITDLVCNTNLMQFTTLDIIKEGIEIIDKVAQKEELRFEKFLIMNKENEIKNLNNSNLKNDLIPKELLGKNMMELKYYLKKPWESVISKGI